jgi:DNA-binding NarL/FixJ family response regulator
MASGCDGSGGLPSPAASCGLRVTPSMRSGAHRGGEQARRELRASGERSRRRAPEARDQLTAQELQIAQLAASGLSNREIGQRLFLSPRTISTHLYRVFPKLGITSRAELSGALAAPPGAG